MGDPLDLPRIDQLPGRDPRGTVSPPRDRPPQKRRPPPRHQAPPGDTETDDDNPVGRRLDVRV
jgi:hypothetical protein